MKYPFALVELLLIDAKVELTKLSPSAPVDVSLVPLSK
jgi:hypothetical protein